jgi:hypothetical protein
MKRGVQVVGLRLPGHGTIPSGLPKLAWNSILPEYNPFNYSSFAINGGDQVYRLARNQNTGWMPPVHPDNCNDFRSA